MGLWDMFRRSPASTPETSLELWNRLGRLEADVEVLKRLELTWHDYRDQLNRLVNRLEKRDQRAARGAEDAPAAAAGGGGTDVPVAVLQARALRERRGR